MALAEDLYVISSLHLLMAIFYTFFLMLTLSLGSVTPFLLAPFRKLVFPDSLLSARLSKQTFYFPPV